MRILIVDDNPYDRELISRRLESELPYPRIVPVGRRSDFEEILDLTGINWDVVLTDYRLGWGTGLDVLAGIRERYPGTPVVMVTDSGSEEVAVEAMKAGLSDYVLKRHLGRLSMAIEECVTRRQLELEHASAVERLMISEARYRAVSEITSDFAYSLLVDESGNLSYEWITEAFTRIAGYDLGEIVGPDFWSEIIHPDDLLIARDHGKRARAGELHSSEFRILTKDGDVRWLQNFIRPEWSEVEGRIVRIVGASQDITDRKVLEEKLRYQANYDLLTGLPNRAHFLARLDEAVGRQSNDRDACPIAVMFLDLDNFKLINDSLGHQMGDALLRNLGHRLQVSMPSNCFVARYGGDEFTVLAEHLASEEDVVSLALQLIELVQEPIHVDGREIVARPNVGIAIGEVGDEAWSLVDRADIALFQAKHLEPMQRYMVFEACMRERARDRLEMETLLRRALEEEEFTVHYQPIIDLESGEICELEALVRWEHPERGTVSPGEFIPVAEANGLILPIGRWVFQEACRQLKDWHARYPEHAHVRMSINLSSRQFQYPDLLAEIQEDLLTSGVSPSSIQLEITESVLMEDTELTTQRLAALKSLGIRLAIDDFGTGYSSLSYLRRFPIDTVKVDRSFVRNIVPSSEDRVLVRAMVVASHALQLQVTIEGVETAEQLQIVTELSCDQVQGFLFSRPLPASELESELVSAPRSDARIPLRP